MTNICINCGDWIDVDNKKCGCKEVDVELIKFHIDSIKKLHIDVPNYKECRDDILYCILEALK